MSWRCQSPAHYLRALLRVLTMLAPPMLTALAFIPGSLTFVGGGIAALSVGMLSGAVSLTAAYLLWRYDQWGERSRTLYRRRGIIRRSEYAIAPDSLISLRIDDTPLTAITRSRIVHLGVRYPTGHRGMTLTLSRDDTARLARRFAPADREASAHEYRAGGLDIVLSCVAGSNFFSGLLITVPFILKAGRYIDSALPERIVTDAADYASRKLSVSPYLALAALLPVFGYAAHFVSNCLRYGRLRCIHCGDTLTIGHGVIGHRTSLLRTDSVTALDIRQTMAMRLFGLRSCDLITCGGRYLMIPAAGDREMRRELAGIYAHSADALTIRPPEDARRSYALRWCVFAVAALAAWLRLYLGVQAALQGAVSLVLLPTAAIFLWRAIVGVAAFDDARVSLFGDCVEIVGIRSMTIHELRVFRGYVDEARITASPFMPDRLCHLYIRPTGSRRGIRCRYLPRERAELILERLG